MFKTKICVVLTVVIAFVFPTVGYSNKPSNCEAFGVSLPLARANYESACNQPRVDCDPAGSGWVCASKVLSQHEIGFSNSKPTAVTSQSGSLSAPSNASAPCIDTDGDGWGWNGQSSCLIKSIQPEVIAPVKNGEPTDCIDTDGDGWGWDGQSSCVMPKVNPAAEGPEVGSPTVNRVVTTTDCTDTDGDGWGWNGQASCKMPSSSDKPTGTGGTLQKPVPPEGGTYTSADITDLILISGQSNALGASITTYDAALDDPHKRVFAFTNNGWQVADLHQIWDRNWHPRNNPDTDPTNNFGFHFGKSLVATDPNRVVGFILATAPGMSISHWHIDGEFYSELKNKTLDAINQLPHKSSIDGLLWHQGESDADYLGSFSYSLNKLIENFQLESWFEQDKPFICGEIKKVNGVNHVLNSLNADNNPYTGCVPATDLPAAIDDAHFLSPALRTLGKRYADLYYEMTR